jgi:hypothetical protein
MPTRNESLAQFANVTANPGANGNVLTSNGTSWTSAAPAATLSGQTDSATPFETSFGYQAGASTTGERNSAFGYQALKDNVSGSDNTAVGFGALSLNTSQRNSAFGSYAMLSNTSGNNNSAFGYFSLASNQTGIQNTAFGYLSLTYCTASNNSAFGHLSLVNVSTGNYNTAVGYFSGQTLTTGSNNTLLGSEAQPSSATVSNEITLGNSAVGTLRCATTTITSLSDERDKKNIIDLPAGLAFINEVRPVAFDWNARDKSKVDIPDTGFLAQNLQQVQAQLGVTIPGLVYDNNPEKLEAGYSKLLPVLVKAIQELSARVEALENAK